VSKETKIGLAILLGLVVVVAGVLAWRLTRSTQTAAAPMEKAVEKEKPAADGGASVSPKQSETQNWTAARPALLPPAGPPSTPPKPLIDDMGPWSAKVEARAPRSDASLGHAAEGPASLLTGAKVPVAEAVEHDAAIEEQPPILLARESPAAPPVAPMAAPVVPPPVAQPAVSPAPVFRAGREDRSPFAGPSGYRPRTRD
jgi:hypothetical protein